MISKFNPSPLVLSALLDLALLDLALLKGTLQLSTFLLVKRLK